jgi:hypothetical protein
LVLNATLNTNLNASNLLTFRYEFSKKSALNPDDVEKYGVKMKKPGEVTLESEYEKIKKVSTIKFMSSEKTPFIIEENTSDRVQKLVNFAFGIC